MEAGRPEGWEAALAHRNKLLTYDQTSARRTKVIDDEGEYFSSGSVWLNKEEREKLVAKEEAEREERHSSRSQRKLQVSLDFAGLIYICMFVFANFFYQGIEYDGLVVLRHRQRIIEKSTKTLDKRGFVTC